jgi:putative spermidine/putrescine transport system substrate-binding protein
MTAAVTRRSLLVGTSLAALAGPFREAAAAGPALDLLKGSGDVVVCTWGGIYTDLQKHAWFDPFHDATGISVSTTGIPDLAKLEIMAKVGNIEWDLIDTEGTMMWRAQKENLLEKIDYDLIFQIVPKEDLEAKMMTEYGIASVAFGTVIAWNTQVNPTGPKDWVEFFDTSRFKGRRALYAQPKPSLEIALMASGVPTDKIYPISIDQAFAALDKIKGKVDLWVEQTSQWDVLMQNREVDLMGGSLSRTYVQKKAGKPFDYHFNQAIVEQSYWTIPKAAPGAKNAQKLIAFMMQKKGMLAMVGTQPFGVANKTIYADLPPSVADQLPSAPKNLATSVVIDDGWWSENGAAVQTRWLSWKSTL